DCPAWLPIYIGTRSGTKHLGDQEGQFEGLLCVQPWVAGRLVPTGQIQIGNVLGPSETFGDILSGQFDVDSTGIAAQFPMHLEKPLNLIDDPIEMPGLVPVGGLMSVAVHRITLP